MTQITQTRSTARKLAVVQKPQKAPEEKIIIEVEAARLEYEGDIGGSHSADTIAGNVSKVRKPFVHGGKFYIATGGTSFRGNQTAGAYEIVPEAEYTDEIISYREGDRNRPGGFYNGMRVLLKNKPHVLKGPEITFATKKSDKPAIEEPTEAITIFPDTVIQVRISEIVPSPFEPQSRRRARFKDEEIESLGNSIEMHGLAQPILVRPSRKLARTNNSPIYEIVFGERRFLAVRKKGIETINCFVRQLSDAQVLELQYEENHRRQNNDPLDDAFFFKFLKERENYTTEDLASRLGTTKTNVENKLVLNDLIPEAIKELTDGLLPLKHAYFLARFPAAAQAVICKEQYAYKYYDRDEKATSYKAFVEECETNITRRLDKASFSTLDPRLRLDGLVCPDCPQRTGYAPSLFTDLTRDDSCLNKSCFEQKTNVHLRLKRDEIAEQRPNPDRLPIEEAAGEVPLVTDRVWTDKKPLGEKPLTAQKFLPEPECEFSELSLIVEGERKGQETYICRAKVCPVHAPAPPQPDLTDADFVRRVEELAREKVLAKSLEAFSDYKPIWIFDDLIQRVIFELWNSRDFGYRRVILRLIKDWKNLPAATSIERDVLAFIASLDKQKQSQLIFLLISRDESVDFVKKLAADYARTDYRIIEAEARLELAPESERELAQDILTVTRGGVNDLRKPDFDLDGAH